MELSDQTPRQYYEAIKAGPARAKFGFGDRPALVNIDLQKAYTAVGEFATAYIGTTPAARRRERARRPGPGQGPARSLDLCGLHGLR